MTYVKEICGQSFRPGGPTDKASDFQSEDCWFDPHRGHFCLTSHFPKANASYKKNDENLPLRVGFEPTREDPIRFRV